MKIAAQILKPCQIDVDVEAITLLSAEEAEKLPLSIRQCTLEGTPSWWWLQSPGYNQHSAAGVTYDGTILYSGPTVNYENGCVRPALKVSNLKALKIKCYENLKVFNREWIVISEDKILCRNSIKMMSFRKDWKAPDANNYDKSDIKRYLEHWLEEQFTEEK